MVTFTKILEEGIVEDIISKVKTYLLNVMHERNISKDNSTKISGYFSRENNKLCIKHLSPSIWDDMTRKQVRELEDDILKGINDIIKPILMQRIQNHIMWRWVVRLEPKNNRMGGWDHFFVVNKEYKEKI